MKQYLVAALSVAARDTTKFLHWEMRKIPHSFNQSDFVGVMEGRMLFLKDHFEYHVPPEFVRVVV
jgi:hypothetical protein